MDGEQAGIDLVHDRRNGREGGWGQCRVDRDGRISQRFDKIAEPRVSESIVMLPWRIVNASRIKEVIRDFVEHSCVRSVAKLINSDG